MKWTETTLACRGLSWGDLARKLTTVLRSRADDEDRFVIVSADRLQRFVQFAAHNALGVLRWD
jgi:hypothetical protein